MCDKKLIQVNEISSGQYTVTKKIRLKSSMLRSDLCNYIDAYTVVKKKITVEEDNDNKKRNKKLTFKNNDWSCILLRSCISKIDNAVIGNTEYLDIVVPMKIMVTIIWQTTTKQ